MHAEVVDSTPETAHVIRNLYPLYLHDLSEFGSDVPNQHGIYEPDPAVRTLAEQGDLAYQAMWWKNPGVLFPFLVLVGRTPIGFALVSSPPYAPSGADFCVQEFFIARPYRGKGIAGKVAVDVFEKFKGRWEIAVLPGNQRARSFWRRTTDRYTRGRANETIGPADSGAMPTFRFDNSRPML